MKHSLVSLALFKKYLFGFIYLVLTVLSLHCCGLSLAAEIRATLCGRAQASWGSGFSCCGAQALVAVAHGLSCSVAACGFVPDQGLNLWPQADS